MKPVLYLLLGLSIPLSAAVWSLDDTGPSDFTVRGSTGTASGVSGQSVVFAGSSLLELKNSSHLTKGEFTVALWFNPYDLQNGQQILAAKNRYARDERQWSLSIEPDGRLRAHIRQSGWSTIACAMPLEAGAWHLATLVVNPHKAALYLNGVPVGEVPLTMPIPATEAPVTLGGVWDAEKVRQPFTGELDECAIHSRALAAAEITASFRPVLSTHELPKPAVLPLWNEAQPLPSAAGLPQAAGTEFHVIKKQKPDSDGARWTLGVGLAWHKGRLYASYGYNQGNENTPTEEAHVRVSEDGGRTWGAPEVMDAGEGDLGVSHGVFLSHEGHLWAFMGAFYAGTKPYHRVHTRAYLLDEASGKWHARGAVLEDGFWPMQEPLRMSDGNWIMAGFQISGQYGAHGNLPAVAISKGDDFTKWEMKVIPADPGLGTVWGESTVLVEDTRILNIARYGKKARALLSVSVDHGRSWTPAAASNLPMATSKPYAGVLSTGQRYLICTTTADTGAARSPLTIAVSKPGEMMFEKVFLIRRSIFPEGPGVSAANADFSYPYAVEHAGRLYVGYTHKSHVANELAVIPVKSLSINP
jgi:hypothetical protein